MSNQSRGLIAALIFALPTVASGQTGILHKSSQAMMKSLPVGAVPATALPGVADGVEVTAAVVDAVGIDATSGPAFTDATLPSPIDGGGLVHILPIDGSPGYAAGFDGGSVHALAIGPPGDALPPGLERAAVMASSHAGGLEQAALATAMGGGRSQAHHRSPAAAQPGARRLSERAVGLRPAAVTASGRGSSSHSAHAATPPVQRVGSGQPATPPRWRDRLRVAWPGTGE